MPTQLGDCRGIGSLGADAPIREMGQRLCPVRVRDLATHPLHLVLSLTERAAPERSEAVQR